MSEQTWKYMSFSVSLSLPWLSEVMHEQCDYLNFVLPALRAGHDGAFVIAFE
jgi:hypothetical protein